ncbi:MAG: pseudouridine synthase [Nitrospinota bacterium]
MSDHPKDKMVDKNRVRLHKIIAKSGISSLREAERLILDGRVSVNDKFVTTVGSSADPINDKIKVDEKLVVVKNPHVYIKCYKPKGYITTRKDDRDRKTVIDLLPEKYKSLYPVGRLDFHSEGLLILSNDGDLTNKITSPKSKLSKIYLVKLKNIPTEKTMRKALTGITIAGEKLKLHEGKIIDKSSDKCWIRVELQEGKNRQIRRLFQALGHPVLKLKRIAIGPIKLATLKSGESTHVTEKELSSLKRYLRKNSS